MKTAAAFTNLLQGDQVSVTIGQDGAARTFKLPRNLLIQKSAWFKEHVSDRQHQETQPLDVSLPKRSPNAFETLVYRMYTDRLPDHPKPAELMTLFEPKNGFKFGSLVWQNQRSEGWEIETTLSTGHTTIAEDCIVSIQKTTPGPFTTWLETYFLAAFLEMPRALHAIVRKMCQMAGQFWPPNLQRHDLDIAWDQGIEESDHLTLDALYLSNTERASKTGQRQDVPDMEVPYTGYAESPKFMMAYHKVVYDMDRLGRRNGVQAWTADGFECLHKSSDHRLHLETKRFVEQVANLT